MRSDPISRAKPLESSRPPSEATDEASHRQPGLATRARFFQRHWLAVVLLTAGLGLRVLAQVAYRPALFYIDSIKYLYNAGGNDPVGYKLPLRAILLVSNLDTVVAVQHLLGLALAVVLYVVLVRRGVYRWLAALAMAPILLDAYQLQSEQSIMPGTWFEALIVAGLAILLWEPRVTWRRAVIAGIVLGTSATVAQVGEALIIPAAIFVLAVGAATWRHAVVKAAVFCAACAVPILLYCTGSFLLGSGFFLSHQGVTSVYGRMAAAADCATIKLPAAEQRLCPTPAQQAKGVDWLSFGTYSPVQGLYNTLPRPEVDSLISRFNRAVLSQQPARVLDAYTRDVLKLFAVSRVTDPGDTSITRWQFQTRFPYYSSNATPATVHAAIDRFGGGRPVIVRPVAAFLRSYQLGGGYTPGPALLAAALAGLAGSAFVLRRRASPDVRLPALACLLSFGCGVFITLVSDLFVFSWRYQLPALVTLVPAGALGISVLGQWLTERRHGAH